MTEHEEQDKKKRVWWRGRRDWDRLRDLAVILLFGFFLHTMKEKMASIDQIPTLVANQNMMLANQSQVLSEIKALRLEQKRQGSRLDHLEGKRYVPEDGWFEKDAAKKNKAKPVEHIDAVAPNDGHPVAAEPHAPVTPPPASPPPISSVPPPFPGIPQPPIPVSPSAPIVGLLSPTAKQILEWTMHNL